MIVGTTIRPTDRGGFDLTVNVGVVGIGAIGAEHVQRLVTRCPGARVVAVSDIDLDRARSTADAVGAAAMADGEDLIRDPDVDAVLVASWGPTHETYVLASIAAGKPVFCEKPLATSAAACLRIVQAEIAHGSPLVQVGFMRRYDAGYRELKSVLDAGQIGTPLMAHCVHRNASVPARYTSSMLIQDSSVHEIDVLRWLLDDEITSTQVVVPRRSTKAPDHLQDPIVLLLETAAGVRADIELFVTCQYGYDVQCELVGEIGAVRLPDPAAATVRVGGRSSVPVIQSWADRFTTAYDVEIAEWVESVSAGTLRGPTAWDGYAASVIADAASLAQESSQIVSTGLPGTPRFYGGN